MTLPDELEDYIHELPNSSQNNSREITRENFQRIMQKDRQTANYILRSKYGLEINYDNHYDVCEPKTRG